MQTGTWANSRTASSMAVACKHSGMAAGNRACRGWREELRRPELIAPDDTRRYDGAWERNRFHGIGTYAWQDGRYYEGKGLRALHRSHSNSVILSALSCKLVRRVERRAAARTRHAHIPNWRAIQRSELSPPRRLRQKSQNCQEVATLTNTTLLLALCSKTRRMGREQEARRGRLEVCQRKSEAR